MIEIGRRGLTGLCQLGDRLLERRVVARLRGGKLAARQPCLTCGTTVVLTPENLKHLSVMHQQAGTDPLVSVFLCDSCLYGHFRYYEPARWH